PLVVALLPLLPAIARMNVPACGALTAATTSAPKRLVVVMLLTSTKAASKVQVNSALVYPSTGTLCKLTVTTVVPPIKRLVGLTVVETKGPPKGVGVALANGSGVFVNCPN